MNKRYSFISATLTLIALASSHQTTTAMDSSGVLKAYESLCVIGGMTVGAAIGHIGSKNDKVCLCLAHRSVQQSFEDSIILLEQTHKHTRQLMQECLGKKEQEIRDLQKQLRINSILINRISQATPINGKTDLADNKNLIDEFLGTSQQQAHPVLQTLRAEAQAIKTAIARTQAELATDRAQYKARITYHDARARENARFALSYLGAALGIAGGFAVQCILLP